jgi:hypothetical protein
VHRSAGIHGAAETSHINRNFYNKHFSPLGVCESVLIFQPWAVQSLTGCTTMKMKKEGRRDDSWTMRIAALTFC